MAKILLVDDDVFIQDIVSQKLAAAGHEMQVVGRGDAVSAAVAADQPELILLDIDLPGMSGVEVLEALRTKDTETPIIIFSNHDDPDTRAKVLELGAQDFYFKAATGADELLDKIKEHLN